MLAISWVMIWFFLTMVSSVSGFRMIASTAVRPTIDSLSGTSTSSPLKIARFGDALVGAAIVVEDGDGLSHVAELAGEIAGVGRLERGIGETLACAVGRGEVFENVQTFAEVRADRGLDDLAAGLGHQASHARELLHLTGVASSARVR